MTQATPDAPSATAGRINLVLMVLGALAGAIGAVPITYLGKIITEAPEATLGNYAWNVGAFAIMGAVFAPVLAWSAMRRVPLWRAIVEPAAGGLIGSVAGILVGTSMGLIALTAAGIIAATGRLAFAYRERSALPEQAAK